VIVYGLIFPAGVYYMIRLIHRGPGSASSATPTQGRPKRPLSATDATLEPAE
jgi:hypothetical protein